MKRKQEDKLPTILFKNRRNNGKNVLYSACAASDALFELMSPRKHLNPSELHLLSKMGHNWEIIGDLREFTEEWERLDNRKKGG